MFQKYTDEQYKELEKSYDDYRHAVNREDELTKSRYEITVAELKTKHSLEIKEKDFEMKHHKDEKVKKAEEEATNLRQEVAVFKKEIEMFQQIVSVNADLVDVKELITNLMSKLPEIKIDTIAVQSQQSSCKKE